MNILYEAHTFARIAHDQQRRKYVNEAYFEHPLRVMYDLMQRGIHSPNILAATLLHDTVEDCGVTFEELKTRFNNEVADLVWELTQPDKLDTNIKKLPRKDRHAALLDKLKGVSFYAKLIKLADRLDNLRSTDLTNKECVGFLKKKYLQESIDIYELLKNIDYVYGEFNWSTQTFGLVGDLRNEINYLIQELKWGNKIL